MDELEMRDVFINALYDSLVEGGTSDMSREEFHKEYHEWGLIVAVYNAGFLAGRSEEQ